LSRLRSDLLAAGYSSVDLNIQERELLIEGWVMSYALKREIELLAVAALSMPLRNNLKVTPGP
jgi:hypothetical protein